MRQTSFRFKLLPILVPLKSWDDLRSGLSWKGGRLSCGKWTFVSTAIFPQTRPPAMSFPVTLKFGLLRLMKQLFPDPASDGSPDHTGDRGTWRSCGGCWSGGRSSTTSPQGQVHVPAGCPQPPHPHLTHISIIHRCPHLCIATPRLIIFPCSQQESWHHPAFHPTLRLHNAP